MDKVARITPRHRTSRPQPQGSEGVPVLQPQRAGKPAAKAFVERLKERTEDRDKKVTVRRSAQLKAIKRWGRSKPVDLSVIEQPTLIANGDNDRMVPSMLSEDLHRRIKNSELIIYPDSGHGGIFQYHDEFVAPHSSSSTANGLGRLQVPAFRRLKAVTADRISALGLPWPG